MRVVIADDHRVVRDGLRWMLSDHPEVEVAGEAATGTELIELVRETEVDIVLLDVRMPGMSGLEALEALRSEAPEVRVIMLSMHDEPVYVRRAVELGASGYLLKSAGRDEIIRALRQVAEGGAYVQGEITLPLLEHVAGGYEAGSSPELSPREREVLGLVARGLENKQIARELGLSEATVKTYLKSVFERLEVRTRAEAVAVALREGLID
ncbi:MAG: response regulator [Acidimicrobiia bacterium]